jgi:hypothetical protein
MAELFDKHDKSFGAVVQSSIDFSGLPHSFFTAPKVEALRELIFLLLPSAAPLARRVEQGLWRVPLGAQYIACGIA